MAPALLSLRLPIVHPLEFVPAKPARVHELELLQDELEQAHREIQQTIAAIERRSVGLIRALQQAIGQHLADYADEPRQGSIFARRARNLLGAASKGRDETGRLVQAVKTLDLLVEEAWIQL